MVVCSPEQPGSQEARLRYRRLRILPSATLLEVLLETGRKHQIRVQLAHRGHPVLGDRKYGSAAGFPHGLALHARRLELQHPVRKTDLRLEAQLPAAWRKFGLRE